MQPDSSSVAQSFVIGPREIYDAAQRAGVGIERLDAKLDVTIATQAANTEQLRQNYITLRADHEKAAERLRIIEMRPVITPKSMWTALGVIAAFITIILTIIIEFIHNTS